MRLEIPSHGYLSFHNIVGYVLLIDLFLSVTYHELVIPSDVYSSLIVLETGWSRLSIIAWKR